MKGYLLDTNHLSDAIERVSEVRERLYAARRAGLRIGTCVPVLCELEVGIQKTRRRDYYRRSLGRMVGSLVRVWPLDTIIAQTYGEIFADLRSRGRVLSQVDMILAAMARTADLTILTSDRDFEALPDIRTENWLK
jgi:tRNA(fMet)-specific endonuclease VapC